MRIICCRFGTKFTDWHVKNLKHMIDNYSGLTIVLKLLKMICMVTGIINFKCMISLEMVKTYILI